MSRCSWGVDCGWLSEFAPPRVVAATLHRDEPTPRQDRRCPDPKLNDLRPFTVDEGDLLGLGGRALLFFSALPEKVSRSAGAASWSGGRAFEKFFLLGYDNDPLGRRRDCDERERR